MVSTNCLSYGWIEFSMVFSLSWVKLLGKWTSLTFQFSCSLNPLLQALCDDIVLYFIGWSEELVCKDSWRYNFTLQKICYEEFSGLFLKEIDLFIDFQTQSGMRLEHLYLSWCDTCTDAEVSETQKMKELNQSEWKDRAQWWFFWGTVIIELFFYYLLVFVNVVVFY